MKPGPDATVGRALRDGLARVTAAPATVAGTLALTLLFSLPPLQPHLTPADVLFSHYLTFATWPPGFAAMPVCLWLLANLGAAAGGLANLVSDAVWLVLWSFLLGGLIDRFARNRPTRGPGFFGACGAHFGPMLRLGLTELAFDLAAFLLLAPRIAARPYVRAVTLLLVVAVGVVVHYARVRLVVEDRRSAAAAILAGGRFVRRNFAGAVTIYLLFGACLVIPYLLLLNTRTADGTWLLLAGGEMLMALQLFLALASLAAATALFQSRLAHASYTAGPQLVWPESPAAEAIANLAPSIHS